MEVGHLAFSDEVCLKLCGTRTGRAEGEEGEERGMNRGGEEFEGALWRVERDAGLRRRGEGLNRTRATAAASQEQVMTNQSAPGARTHRRHRNNRRHFILSFLVLLIALCAYSFNKFNSAAESYYYKSKEVERERAVREWKDNHCDDAAAHYARNMCNKIEAIVKGVVTPFEVQGLPAAMSAFAQGISGWVFFILMVVVVVVWVLVV